MDQISYKIVHSSEGLSYVKLHNGKLQDFNKIYTIPSYSGSVYSLPNGEVVLINLIEGPNYPGFIFKNYQAFEKCVHDDYFPIPEESMSWLETQHNNMQKFLINDSFYLNPLSERLNIKVPFEDLSDCEDGYNKLRAFIKSKSKSLKEKEVIFHCYGLCAIKFFIEKKKFKWNLVKAYQIYNPYYYPSLSDDERTNINVFNKLDISFGDKSKGAFKFFVWSITKTPYDLLNN